MFQMPDCVIHLAFFSGMEDVGEGIQDLAACCASEPLPLSCAPSDSHFVFRQISLASGFQVFSKHLVPISHGLLSLTHLSLVTSPSMRA